MENKWFWPFVTAVVLLVCTLAGSWWRYEYYQDSKDSQAQKETEEWEQFEKVHQAFDLIADNYVEQVDKNELTEGAIKGMLDELKDPYSVYMDAETTSQFQQTLDSSFQGIGAEINYLDGKFVIVSPFKHSPAEKAGIKPGDVIISVDQQKTEGLELYDVVSLIRGKVGTKVEVGIMREGNNQPIKFSVERAEIPLETVHRSVKKLNGKLIGYLQITSFSEHTAEDFVKELSSLEASPMDGLLIDVRGNPGGLLTSVEEILRQFITDKKPYIQIEERNGKKNQYFSYTDERKPYPIAVLMNEGSASAAEIFAAAMNESEGYPLIGEKTFGKGTVQKPVDLGDGSTIKLTFYKWLTPNGTWIHKKGIKPTIGVSQKDYYSLEPLTVEQSLEKDMNNKQVMILQKMLEGAGYEPGRTDGYYSGKTVKAVEAFQRMHDIRATGIADKSTVLSLQEEIKKLVNEDKNDLQLQAGLRWLEQQ